MRESEVLRQCLELLRLHNVFHWRANAGGGLRRGRAGRTVPVKANPAGTPDILAVFPVRSTLFTPSSPDGVIGRLVGIEVKRPGGRRSPAQAAWAENAGRLGVLCLEVSDVRQLEELLIAEGLIR